MIERVRDGLLWALAPVSAVVFVIGCSLTEPVTNADVETAERDAPPVGRSVPDAAPDVVNREQAHVTYIVDGDTFDVILADGTEERIRPPQIDTPEIGECGYEEAAAALEELILGRTVYLASTAAGPDRDSYDRLLRAVEVDGHDVGELLVLAGAARWVPRYAHEDARLATMYEAAERESRSVGAGFWTWCDWE